MSNPEHPATGSSTSLASCPTCDNLMSPSETRWRNRSLGCDRCGTDFRLRKPDSIKRTLALSIAAATLYVPANVLPVMHTGSILGDEDDTIFSGVMVLAHSGSWPLAILVFFASMFVPIFKLIALGTLVFTTMRTSKRALLHRTKLLRAVEFVGRWSMLDVFVVTILVSLVQFEGLATVIPGAGAMAFAAVVVLTMLAAQSFDSRLMWDAMGTHHD